jgi:hypothetical protein
MITTGGRMQKRAVSPLEQDMARIAKAHAPSMVPQWHDKPEVEEEPAPDLREVVTDRAAQLRLIRLVNSAMIFKAQKAEAAKAEKPVVNAIKQILSQWDVGRVMVDGHKLNYFDVPRRSIKEDKLTLALLDRGMSPAEIKEVVALSTVEKTSSTLKITMPGAGGDEEEE